jgi:hypothetical protein
MESASIKNGLCIQMHNFIIVPDLECCEILNILVYHHTENAEKE